jgi:hypothetical protein
VVAGCLQAVVALAGAGCGRTKSAVPPDAAAGGDVPASTATLDATAHDAPECFRPSVMTPGLVCFGDDAAPYLAYLAPRDGGPAVGLCPAPSDFDLYLGEADPGYFPCGGPLTRDQLAAAEDAGAPRPDAGNIACCYWVEERWGF